MPANGIDRWASISSGMCTWCGKPGLAWSELTLGSSNSLRTSSYLATIQALRPVARVTWETGWSVRSLAYSAGSLYGQALRIGKAGASALVMAESCPQVSLCWQWF